MTFVADFEILGKVETVDLKEGGKDIDVAEGEQRRVHPVSITILCPPYAPLP